MKSFDAIIIGAGQAGIPLAKKLASAGWTTAIIEKRWVGGTCINDGCTPTKAMVASARMAYLASKSSVLGVDIDNYQLNFKKVMSRKDEIVEQFRAGATKGILETAHLELFEGKASFLSNDKISILNKEGEEEILSAQKIFINTGTSPVIPDIDGIDTIPYLTSTSILALEEVPEHLLIIGGGYIGLEFGQMFSRFGAKVTLLERGKRLMPKEDDDVCEVMSGIFEEEGINVLVNSKVVKLEKQGADQVKVYVETKDGLQQISCSHVLIASGRKPHTEALQLHLTDVTCDEQGFIVVNDRLETKATGIYALGDVKGGPAFTHISYNDHLVVTENLLHQGHQTIKGRMLPYCMFTDPQLGRVGITEDQAIEQKLDYLVAKIPMKNVARAIETAEVRGFMKAIVDKNTKQILGATIIGEEGGEVMSVLQMAMMGNITYKEVRNTIFAHPLYAESLNNLFMSLDD